MSEPAKPKTKRMQGNPEDEQNEPDMRGLLVPANFDSKITVPRDLITNDKNLKTKTRIPAPFALTVINDLDSWDTYDTAAKAGKSFEENYSVHQISRDGLSRGEYGEAAAAYLMGAPREKRDAVEKINEGVRKGS